MNTDLSVLIETCDRYAFLWDEHKIFWDKFWKLNIPVYVVGETRENPHFETFLAGEKSWTEVVRFGLEQIKTPYVLFLLIDYFPKESLEEEEIERYFRFIRENNVQRFGIHPDSEHYDCDKFQEGYFRLSQRSDYPLSTQAAIWNRDFLFKHLVGRKSPWEFEINTRVKNHNIWFKPKDWYWNVLHRGHYSRDYKKAKLCV